MKGLDTIMGDNVRHRDVHNDMARLRTAYRAERTAYINHVALQSSDAFGMTEKISIARREHEEARRKLAEIMEQVLV